MNDFLKEVATSADTIRRLVSVNRLTANATYIVRRGARRGNRTEKRAPSVSELVPRNNVERLCVAVYVMAGESVGHLGNFSSRQIEADGAKKE